MRGWIIALSLLGPGAALAETFPYTATVTSLNVTARSGPSFGTYPTERLPKHSQVEVQRTEGAGWAAIRPTREAFDWLPASAVKLTTDRKQGEIVVDRAPAYIGSNVRKIDEHVSQTDLKKGNTVRVLAEKSVSRGAGKSELWLKIAPPAGEVRWVQTKHLSTDSPQRLAAGETQERLAREERYRRENAIDPPGLLANVLKGGREIAEARPDEEVARAQFLRRGKPPLLNRKPRQPAAPAAEEELSSIEIDNGQPSEAVSSESKDEAAPRAPSDKQSRVSLDPEGLTAREPERELPTLAPPVKTVPPPVSPASSPRPIDSEEFKQRLTRLHVDLTSMVAEDSSKWSLTLLRRRAEELVELGPSPLERGKARLLLDRIAEFAATLPPGHNELSRESPVAIAAATTEKKPDFVTQYDAVGYLMPIVGARPGTPQYQLTDKDGRSLSLVSAQPGINLNAYVKKQVGLYGQRGYVESLKKHHILAERVVDLDLHRR